MAGAPATYDALKVTLRDALAIDSASAYATDVDTFIDAAESRFQAMIRHRRMLSTATLTMDANGEASLPDDYVGFHRATAVEGARSVPLIECSPEWMQDEYPVDYGGIGRHICIDGSVARVRPITGTVRLRYYAEIPALSDANTSNWLLSQHPMLYVAASLYEAAIYYDDPEGQQRYGQQMADQMTQLFERDRAERSVGRRLGVKGPTP